MDKQEEGRTPFGRRLVDAREDAGYTQASAARLVGMSQGTLAEAEASGKRSGYTSQLAALYKVSPTWLATGKGGRDVRPGNVPSAPPRHSRKLVQNLCDIAEGINDIGLRRLIMAAETEARLYPLTSKHKKKKAA